MNPAPCIAMLLLAAVTTAMTTACQREEAPATGQEPAVPPAPTASAVKTPPLAEGAEMTYACAAGELRVVYASSEARVSLADGRELVLPRSPREDGPGQESYEAAGTVLRRRDNNVKLRLQGGETLECIETSATA